MGTNYLELECFVSQDGNELLKRLKNKGAHVGPVYLQIDHLQIYPIQIDLQ